MSDELPPDPFTGGLSDLAGFASNCHNMYAAMLGAGFDERQALRFTIDLTVGMLGLQQKDAPKPPGS